jgi:multiple sugar transport system permease protein
MKQNILEKTQLNPLSGVKLKPLRLLENLQPYFYLLPALLMIGLWVYRPLLQTIELSFFQWNLLPFSPKVYVGWENYQRIVTLPEMRQALTNTLIYIVGILPLSVFLPLIIAVLTDNIRGRFREFYRALIFLPMIMAPVVVSVIWRWILHPFHGIVNVYLNQLGIGTINFLRDPRLAIWTIIFITGWKLLGFSTLIFSAAIANINKDYIEASQLDGANGWQRLWYITLPLVSPTTLFMLMLSVLLSAQWSFAYINVLTQGGPQNATTNVYYLLWRFGFGTFAVGWSSAAAILLFVGFGIIAYIFTRLNRRYAFYDS